MSQSDSLRETNGVKLRVHWVLLFMRVHVVLYVFVFCMQTKGSCVYEYADMSVLTLCYLCFLLLNLINGSCNVM